MKAGHIPTRHRDTTLPLALRRGIKLLAVLLPLTLSSAWGAVADDIKALMEQGKFAEAYQLGRQNPDQQGDAIFDFYHGIAALEAGAPSEGVLSLERYILAYPGNRNARFNLARGYYILGEDARARDEFSVLREGAEPGELAAIERYLDAIRARESRYTPTSGVWLEAGLGYDDNITSGVSGHQVAIPGFAVLDLVPNSTARRRGDSFYTLAAGASATLPIVPGIALYGGGSLDARNYFQSNSDQFDTLNINLSGGASYLVGKNLFRATLFAQQQQVYRQDYLLTYGISGDWAYQLDQFNRFNLGLTLGRQDYSNMDIHTLVDKSDPRTRSASSLRSADTWSVTGSWTHVFSARWQPVLALSAAYAREANRKDRPDFSRDLATLRAQLSLNPAPRWGLSLGVNYFHAKHDGQYHPFPGAVARRDDSFGLDAALSYRLDKHWTLRGEAQWNTQDSNIGLFDYSRNAVAAKLRYEFY